MNSINMNPNAPYSLLRIGEAWRNRAGLVTLMLTFLLTVLLSGIGASTGQPMLIVVFGLLAFVVYMIGICAAGIQFMDQAAGRPVNATIGALVASPMVVLRNLGLFVVLLIGGLAYTVVEAIIMFLCKIPGLGPLLYVVTFPVLVFADALVFLGLVVAAALSFPALCEGHSLKTALSQLWAVAVQRPVEAILNLVLLFIVFAFIVGLVSVFIGVGFANTGLMSAAILGAQMSNDFGEVLGTFTNRSFGGGSSGLIVAGAVGSAVVVGIAGTLFAAMALLGLSLTYLKVSGGVDVAAAQAKMDVAIAKTKEKAQQAADEARRRANVAQLAAQQRMEQARTSHAARAAISTPAALACPACKAVVMPEEVFCGNCGHKLR
jgi:hypothetical protein